MIIRRGIMLNDEMQNNRSLSIATMADGSLSYRNLEKNLRDAGASRRQAKELISRCKIVEDMTDSELRDAGLLDDDVYETQRDAESSNCDFDSLMDKWDKLQTQ